MNDITAFALMYPNAYSRNPGDIDVWVNASREQITEYAKKHFKLGDDIRLQHLYHHFFDEGIGMRQIIDYFLVVYDFSKNVFLNNDLSNHPVNFSNHPVPLSKEGSTFSPSPSSSRSGDVTAPSRCSEPLRSKDGGPSKVSPNCAGWDRRDAIGDIASDASVSSAFRTWHFFWRMKNKKL